MRQVTRRQLDDADVLETFDRIVVEVCEAHALRWQAIFPPRRTPGRCLPAKVVRARTAVIQALRGAGWSAPAIARKLMLTTTAVYRAFERDPTPRSDGERHVAQAVFEAHEDRVDAWAQLEQMGWSHRAIAAVSFVSRQLVQRSLAARRERLRRKARGA